MLWQNPNIMLRLLMLLFCSELVRTAFFVSVLPVLKSDLGLSTSAVGFIFFCHYAMDALGKGPMGVIGERFGLGKLVLLSSIFGLISLLSINKLSFPMLTVFFCTLWGLFYSSLWPGVMSASHTLAIPDRLSRVLAISNLSVAPAIILGILAFGPLAKTEPKMAWDVLTALQIFGICLGISLIKINFKRLDAPNFSLKALYGISSLLPASLAQTLAPGLMSTLLYPILDSFGLSINDLFPVGLIAGIAFAFSLWVSGRVADKLHPKLALIPGLTMLVIVFCSASLVSVANAKEYLVILSIIIGVGYGAFVAGWNGLVARVLPENHRAAAWGTIMAVESLGYALGSLLGGVAWQLYGHSGVFAEAAAIFFAVKIYYLVLWYKNRL